LDFFSFVHDANPLYAIAINVETRWILVKHGVYYFWK
jgi:hypothetical protein